MIGLYKGSTSRTKAEAAGLKVMSVADAVKSADVSMVLIPDEKQASVYEKDILPNLEEGNALAFAHGFNIHYGTITPPDNVDVFIPSASSSWSSWPACSRPCARRRPST